MTKGIWTGQNISLLPQRSSRFRHLILQLNFSSMYQIRFVSLHSECSNCFAISTLAVIVIGVRGKVDQKFELLIVDGHDVEDIQVVSTSNTLFSLSSF